MAIASFMLVNQSILPYNLDNDIISLKVTFMLNNRMSFKSNIAGSIYGNIGSGGSAVQLSSFTTNDYGVAEVRIPTSSIANKDINTCRLWATGSYNGSPINSVIVRANFIYHTLLEQAIVTAGACSYFPSDRSSYILYDGGDLCASGVTTRNVDFILDRGANGC